MKKKILFFVLFLIIISSSVKAIPYKYYNGSNSIYINKNDYSIQSLGVGGKINYDSINCSIPYSSLYSIDLNIEVRKWVLTLVESDGSWGGFGFENENLSLHIRASNSGFLKNYSLIDGIFVFNKSGVKGFLTGSLERAEDLIILKGTMIGGGYSDDLEHNSVFNIYILNKLSSCWLDIFGIEDKDEQNNYEERISTLESWKQSIQTTITNILQSIALIFTKIDNYSNSSNSTNPDYFKYLSSSDRQGIVCGYAKDKHLTNYSDLGWNCNVTYRYSVGKEYASCRCKKV